MREHAAHKVLSFPRKSLAKKYVLEKLNNSAGRVHVLFKPLENIAGIIVMPGRRRVQRAQDRPILICLCVTRAINAKVYFILAGISIYPNLPYYNMGRSGILYFYNYYGSATHYG